MGIRSVLLSLSILLLAACASRDSSSVPVNPRQLTSIKWIDSLRNFGKINEGQKVALSFKFKNTGAKPLVIESVKPSCGCTVADYPREPVQPGEEGEITGEFDSDGRQGQQHKEITVTSNTPDGSQKLIFEVDVTARPPETSN